MNLRKKLVREAKLARISVFVAILTLSSLFSSLGFDFVTGSDVAQAVVGGQTPLANPRLTYNQKTKNFYATGENKSTGAIYLQNQDNPGQCANDGPQYKIATPGGGDGARATFDTNGNAYMIWREGANPYGTGASNQIHFTRISSDCSSSSGNVNLQQLLSRKFGINNDGGSPNITYSCGDKRIYISMQVSGPNGGNLYVASAPVNGDGSWSDASNWDYMSPNLVAGANSTEMGTMVLAGPNADIHAFGLRTETGGNFIKAVDLIGGVGQPWRTYGGAGLAISSVIGDGYPRAFEISSAIAPDGTAYAGWIEFYGSKKGVGVSRWEPGTRTWSKLGNGLLNAENAPYTGTLRGIGLAASSDNATLYIAINGDSDAGTNVGFFTNRGASFAGYQRISGYSAGASVLGTFQQNNRVCVFVLTGDRQNFYNCLNGGGSYECTPYFTSVDAVVDTTGYYSPTPSDPNTRDANGLQPLVYYPLPKAIRLLDTRPIKDPNTDGYYNPTTPRELGSLGQFQSDQTRTFRARRIDYNGISIPREAQAVLGTATAANPPGSGFGYLSVYPGPSTAPRPKATSTLLYKGGQYISNSATMSIGSDDTINLYTFIATDVVVDINGYFAPPGSPDPNNLDAQNQPRTDTGLLYYPLSKPTRLLDTRPTKNLATDGKYNNTGAIQPFSGQAYVMTGFSYNGISIPSSALAIVFNNTVADPGGAGYLTVYSGNDPGGNSRPTAASVVYSGVPFQSGQTTVGVGTGGNVTFFSSSKTDMVADAIGYYAPVSAGLAGGLYYFALTNPIRLLDTRQVANPATDAYYNLSKGTASELKGGKGVGVVQQYQFGNITYGSPAVTIPNTARALETNVQVVVPPNTNGFGFLTVYPSDGTAPSGAAIAPPLAYNNLIYGLGNTATSPAGLYINNAVTMTLGPTDQKVNIYGFTTGQ